MNANNVRTKRGILALFFGGVIIGLFVVIYGVILTATGGNASKFADFLYDFEIFIKWVAWCIGIISVLYIAFSSKGIVQIFSLLGVVLSIIALITRIFNAETNYSEHIFNGLTIMGLTLSLYKDVKENL
ncbi:hypothetical protein ACMX2M_26685 [Paenibacillus polymyxa]